MYMIPYLPFYNFLVYHLPQALYNYPDLFGTKDAKDVILAVYSVSGYDKIGSIEDYQQSLIDNAYCYFMTCKANFFRISSIFAFALAFSSSRFPRR